MARRADIVRSVHFLTASSPLAMAMTALCACSQPPTLCTAEIGEGVVRYTVASPPSPAAACANSRSARPQSTGRRRPTQAVAFPIGVEGYPSNPADPNGPNTPASVALQPEWIGARLEDAQLNAAVDPALSAGVQAAMASYPYASAAAVPQPPPQGTGHGYPYAFGQFESVTPDSSGIMQGARTCMISDLGLSGHSGSYGEPADRADPNIDPGTTGMDGGPGIG